MSDLELKVQVPEMRRIKQIHFVGIGGAGMCGIAEVLLNQGYIISGSDMCESATTLRLIRLGVSVHPGHDAKHLHDKVDQAHSDKTISYHKLFLATETDAALALLGKYATVKAFIHFDTKESKWMKVFLGKSRILARYFALSHPNNIAFSSFFGMFNLVF